METRLPLDPELHRRIAAARERLDEAERSLAALVDTLEVNARADKRMIGEALRTALETVVSAKGNLAYVLQDPDDRAAVGTKP